jgi:hypothetical protein
MLLPLQTLTRSNDLAPASSQSWPGRRSKSSLPCWSTGTEYIQPFRQLLLPSRQLTVYAPARLQSSSQAKPLWCTGLLLNVAIHNGAFPQHHILLPVVSCWPRLG